MPGPVQVTHEWATLRSVVVGRPFYRIVEPFPDRSHAGLSLGDWQVLKAQEGRLLADAFPRLHARAWLQMAQVADLLRSYGVTVQQVPEFDPGEEGRHDGARSRDGSMQFFPRDPMLIVGEHVLCLTLGDPRRRREWLPLQRLLAHLPGVPEPTMMPGCGSPVRTGRVLEGGDCLINGRELYVGVSGRTSDMAGVEWLQAELGSKWTVTPVRVDPAFPHLDTALSLVRPGLGVCCRDGLPDGLPASLDGWDWIEVTPHQACRWLATNLLPIDAGTTLVSEGAPEVGKALERCGQDVRTVPFDGVTWLRGGLRCWTLPLVRAD